MIETCLTLWGSWSILSHSRVQGVNLVRKMPRVRHFISMTTLISICMTRKTKSKPKQIDLLKLAKKLGMKII